MSVRDYSPIDRLLIGFDQATRTLFGHPQVTERPNPARQVQENMLSDAEKSLASRLLRANHAGEICTQALYHGQALTSKHVDSEHLERAAQEEGDHLYWCEGRLKEFDSHASLFNPIWYAGAFTVGALAGLVGDTWSLGMVAESESQMESQLWEHISQLPDEDLKSRAILEQIRQDESMHANQARMAGGAELPEPVKLAVGLAARIMTNTSYWL